MSAQPAAELTDVHYSYATPGGAVPVLDGISLAFEAASSTAVVGRSGSGKSTLVSTLCLMRRVTSGEVTVAGRATSGLSERDRSRLRGSSIGVIFQSFHLDHTLDAADNIVLPWVFSSSPLSLRGARARAVELLDGLGIADLAGRSPAAMSGGQRQRVAIARALFGAPSLLIADEPTGNLDEDTAGEVARQLLVLAPGLGSAVVIVTHDVTVASMADRTLTLTHGRIDATESMPGPSIDTTTRGGHR